MQADKKSPIDSILDWHLDRIDETERAWIDKALREDAELRAKSDRLGKILQPLDHWPVSAAPPNLADKVLANLERHPNAQTGSLRVPADGAGHRRVPWLAVRDVLAAAACVALLVGVFVPSLSVLRQESQRAMCAGNLGSIFRGISTYQQAFAGSLPFAGRVEKSSWLPGGAVGRPYASNSRHLYLLTKLNYGPTPEDFVCPGCANATPMSSSRHQLANSSDFSRACNNSYASLNLSGSSPNLRPRIALAYLADANPLFVNARFDESVPCRTNSSAHGGKGQTVLTLDGSARWTTTPVNSANGDNLWLAGNIRRYTGVEVPTSNEDAHLVPGYPVTDPIVQHRRAN